LQLLPAFSAEKRIEGDRFGKGVLDESMHESEVRMRRHPLLEQQAGIGRSTVSGSSHEPSASALAEVDCASLASARPALTSSRLEKRLQNKRSVGIQPRPALMA